MFIHSPIVVSFNHLLVCFFIVHLVQHYFTFAVTDESLVSISASTDSNSQVHTSLEYIS